MFVQAPYVGTEMSEFGNKSSIEDHSIWNALLDPRLHGLLGREGRRGFDYHCARSVYHFAAFLAGPPHVR